MVGGAQSPGICYVEASCGLEAEEVPGTVEDEETGELVGSEDLLDTFCNDAANEAAGEDLSMADYMAWTAVTFDLTACETDADCGSGEACATFSLDTTSAGFCADYNGGCSITTLKEEDDDDDADTDADEEEEEEDAETETTDG